MQQKIEWRLRRNAPFCSRTGRQRSCLARTQTDSSISGFPPNTERGFPRRWSGLPEGPETAETKIKHDVNGAGCDARNSVSQFLLLMKVVFNDNLDFNDWRFLGIC